MELRHWQRDDSERSESGESAVTPHDENCPGCLRIMEEEEERYRVQREKAKASEDDTDLQGEHPILALDS